MIDLWFFIIFLWLLLLGGGWIHKQCVRKNEPMAWNGFKLILRRTVEVLSKLQQYCSRSNVKYFDLVTHIIVVNLYFKTLGDWTGILRRG